MSGMLCNLGHSTKDSVVFQKVEGLEGETITKVACGWEHTLALSAGGKLYSCGSNLHGQLGQKLTATRIDSPQRVDYFTDGNRICDVAAGMWHSLTLMDDGGVYSWGSGKHSQLGYDVPHKQYKMFEPCRVELPEAIGTVVSITAGSHHSAVLTDIGNVIMWGSNTKGQLARDPSEVSKVHKPLVLDQSPFNGERLIELKSGWEHCLALTDKGSLFAWGRADYGQLGRGVVTNNTSRCQHCPSEVLLAEVVIVSCGSMHNIALKEEEGGITQAYTWGWNEHGMCGSGTEDDVLIPTVIDTFKHDSVHLIGCGTGCCFAAVNQNLKNS
ncbi:PREDICTED: secretion-regulating guanine nucleotide exchange factor-like [Priapulus caudatus]|uniref:Secretion-regulating guanine nucleotide exchange factor-like n=1 Tax=Priapulus caudatus TaxID=37621 RepID=A0ABM1EGG0_PRICU|nr:PREDICTED: secretion-regulating guanine nucleotide exchange factor-like [Priapulus caudatus]